MAAMHRDAPLVSVVVPFHERRHLLDAVVATVSAQSLQQLELIIVDDGSRDRLAEAVGALNTAFPLRFIRFEQNRGAASARNAGIDAATGRYVALLDSDDGWHPDKLRQQVEQLEAARGRKLVSLTRQLVRGRNLHVAPARLMTEADGVGSYLFLQGGVIQSSMIMLERALAAEARFEDGGRGHDDWSFALRLEALGARFAMLAEPLTIYDDAAGRVRRSPNYSPARLAWLGARRAQLGEAAYWTAVAAVASRLRRGDGLNPAALIMTAYRNGAISAARTGYYLAAWGFPPLRSLARHARERWAAPKSGAGHEALR